MASITNITTPSSLIPVTNVEPVTSGSQSSPNQVTPVVSNQTTAIVSLENRCQISLSGFPPEIIKLIFMHGLSSGDFRGFKALSVTNRYFNNAMRQLVNEVALTCLCPNLRILDACAGKFQPDLDTINKHKALLSYYNSEPFVEDRAGLTIIFNRAGLTLAEMKKDNGVSFERVHDDDLIVHLDGILDEGEGVEMVSNAPITETRGQSFEAQDKRLLATGFDGKVTPRGCIVLGIATHKELGIGLFGTKMKPTYVNLATHVAGSDMAIGFSRCLLYVYPPSFGDSDNEGAAGRLKLEVSKKITK